MFLVAKANRMLDPIGQFAGPEVINQHIVINEIDAFSISAQLFVIAAECDQWHRAVKLANPFHEGARSRFTETEVDESDVAISVEFDRLKQLELDQPVQLESFFPAVIQVCVKTGPLRLILGDQKEFTGAFRGRAMVFFGDALFIYSPEG